jgi:Peptidase family M28/PDZ domain/PA domain
VVSRPLRWSWTALFLALAACGPEVAPLSPQPPPAAEAPPPPPAPAIADDPPSAARILADVTYLASPALAGRGTGEEGSRLAAELVAKRFAELKLAPMGDRDEHGALRYEQAFHARVGAKAVLAEAMVARPRGVKQALEAVLADGSGSGAAQGDAVLVGYGITASAAGWDDYGGADLSGKIAVVLDGVPPADRRAGAKAGEPDALRDFGSVRYKIRTAREHKAAGVILVTRAAALPAPPSDASSMGLPALMVTVASARTGLGSLMFGDEGGNARTWTPAKAPGPRPFGASVALATKVEPVEAPSANVVGLLPARADAPKRDEYVVVGAHYDHLGHGGPASRAPGSHEIHPGADDNASGTALVLEVARRFAALSTPPDRNVLFMAFGAEELGVLGSRYWVEHPTVPLDHVVAMINADMVGRLRDNRLIVDGIGTAAGWRPLVDKAAEGLGLDLAFGAEGFGASDHATFTAVRIPVEFFFTGVHPDYHMPTDTADKIDAQGEERVVTLAGRLALAVAQAPERLAFVDAPSDPHSGMRGGFKVSLGTIPDYAYSGKGLRLDGVRPDAPAARGGLQRGDVIVKVGSHDVSNIHDYMFALGELEPGREVVIEVERDGKRVPLKVVPAPGR